MNFAGSPKLAAPFQDSRRLGWSLLASLLLHLALVADTVPLYWPEAMPSTVPVFEVRFSAIRNSKADPVRNTQQRSSGQARSRANAKPDTRIAEPILKNDTVAALLPRPALNDAVAADRPLPEVTDVAAASPPKVVPAPISVSSPPPDPLAEAPQETSLNLPENGKVVYQFYWGRAHWLAGHAIHEWIVKDGYYSLSSSVTTTGLFALLHPTRLVETAKGLVVGGRLRPLQFSTQLNQYPEILAFFNWEKGYFRWYREKSSSTQPLPADSYDKISFLYQLYLARDSDRPSSAHITTGRGLVRYEIENLGLADIELDGRILPSLHLRKSASAADPDVIDVWLSATHGIPIRITHATAGGDYFEQLISPESLPPD